jgi:putative heme-binding domain-containing protein
MPPIMFSTGPTFRPVDVKIGPDGAIYVADFSNEIVGHYTFSFRDPRRENSHGRIWRITAKNRPLVERPKLIGLPLPELLDKLKSPENYVRYQAKRLLSAQERQKVISALAQWTKQLDVNDAEYEHHLMEALTVYEIHNFVEPSLLKKLLRARDFRARAYATRVIGHWHPNLESPLDLLKFQVMDEHPRVRLEAVIALSYIPSTRAMDIAAMAVDKPMDRFLDYALNQVVHALKPYWVPAFTSGKLTFDNNQRRIEFVLTADSSVDTLRPLLAQLQSDRLTPDTREQFLKIIANVGGPAELATVFGSKTYTTAAGYNAKLHAKMLPALATADLLRRVRPAGELGAPLASLIEQSDEALRVEALKLVGVWKLEALRSQVTKSAEARESSDPVRRAAIESVSRLGGEKSLELLKQLSAPPQPEKVRFMAIAGLATLDIKAAARQAAEALSASSGENDPSETFSAFLQQTGGSRVLAEVLRPKKIAVNTAKAGLRLMNSAGRQDAELIAVLNKAGEMEGEIKDLAKKGLTKEDLAALTGEVRAAGDPVRGKSIFHRSEQLCSVCHAIGGEGGNMGPDLSAIGTGMPVDFIIEKLLFPNRSVKQAYVSIVVTTKDGKEFQGYKLREDNQELVLKDVLKNEETRIRADNIKAQTERGSLMPAGLVNNLSRSEFRDLVRFLAGLGAPAP